MSFPSGYFIFLAIPHIYGDLMYAEEYLQACHLTRQLPRYLHDYVFFKKKNS